MFNSLLSCINMNSENWSRKENIVKNYSKSMWRLDLNKKYIAEKMDFQEKDDLWGHTLLMKNLRLYKVFLWDVEELTFMMTH